MVTIKVRPRGCGIPKEGGFYAIGGGKALTCFAMPVALKPCECCSQMPKTCRCPTLVTGKYLHLLFQDCEKNEYCHCCVKQQVNYWISWVGSDYTTDSFIKEVNHQGLSRRIPPSFAKLIKPGDLHC